LVEVTRNDPFTGKERDGEELKKLANDFLTLALGLDVQEITDFGAISEFEALKLKKISPAGTSRRIGLPRRVSRKTYRHLPRLPVGVLFELSQRSVIVAQKPGEVAGDENRGPDLFAAQRISNPIVAVLAGGE
jgi:hypothetical protein